MARRVSPWGECGQTTKLPINLHIVQRLNCVQCFALHFLRVYAFAVTLCRNFRSSTYAGSTTEQQSDILSSHRALWNLYIVHSPTNAFLLNLEKFKIYIKIHINIAPTCFGLRQGNLYRAWLKNRNITLAMLCTSSLRMVEDRNMYERCLCVF